MNIIYDNIIYSLQRYGGISVVWSHLVTHVIQKIKGVRIMEYDDAQQNISRKSISLPEEIMIHISSKWMKLKRYFNPSIPKEVKLEGKFIFHSSYYRTLNHPDAINVTTVHDFAYEFFVKNPIIRFMHCQQKHRAIRNSDHVVCISQNTRNDLLRLLPDVSPEKVSVIYNGVDRKFYRLENASQGDYAFFVGNRDRYKNFMAIIQPLAECGIPLKIAGKPLLKHEVEAMESCHLQYEYCGLVTDDELNRLYNSAFFLMYTSLYEGFGLPVLEAQTAGCPVIALNTSSIPEVIGDKRMLIDEVTTKAISEKVALLRDPAFRNEVIETGLRNANNFSWQKMADEYTRLYETLLK